MHDVIIIGGGLGGLCAAAYLRQRGARVALLERAPQPGGRALSLEDQGYHLDLGPHALYRQGAGVAALSGLGIQPVGSAPPLAGVGLLGDTSGALPTTPWRLLTTRLLSLRGRLALARVLSALPKLDTAAFDHMTWQGWLHDHVQPPDARALLAALARLATYSDAPAVASAGATLAQLRLGLGGVLYLDGGWRSLIGQLTEAAAGTDWRLGCRAVSIDGAAGDFQVGLEGGAVIRGAAVVIAAGPKVVDALLGTAFAEALIPARAAALAVGLPASAVTGPAFALGIDAPLYLSDFSRGAQVAPAGGAVIHVARYLSPNARGDRASLEALLDRLHPRWRAAQPVTRYFGQMTVSHAIPAAADGGLAGRPAVQQRPGICLAGDWVGPEGLLADAALASGRAAARSVLGISATDEAPHGAGQAAA